MPVNTEDSGVFNIEHDENTSRPRFYEASMNGIFEAGTPILMGNKGKIEKGVNWLGLHCASTLLYRQHIADRTARLSV